MHRPRPKAHDASTAPDLWGLFGTLAPLLGLAAAGAGLGLTGAYWLRRRGLAATWSLPSVLPGAFGVAALGLGAPPLASVAFLLLATGFAVALIGASIHLRTQDRRAGGDREVEAARRRGVLDRPLRRIAERDGASPRPDAIVPLGRDSRGRLCGAPRGSASSGAHVLIPGATGAGKTTTLAAMLGDYVVRSGHGAVVLEAKSDRALLEAARRAAGLARVPFRLVSAEGPDGYDPLAGGGVDERSERLVAVHEWGSGDADFYRQAASPFLRCLLEVLAATPGPVSLQRAAAHCDPDRLRELAVSGGPDGLAETVKRETAALGSEERRAIAGMAARLRNLATSQFASRWLDPEALGSRAVDLRAALARREVVYFRLDTDRTGNVGRAIAQMALLDLGATASAAMDSGRSGTFVAIDEFGALEASAVERLFARGRGAGFSVAIGTQTVADLGAAGPAVRERIAATVAAIVCHRLGSQEDAEWVARAIGTVPCWETTTRTDALGLATGEGTRTRGHRFEVNPAELQRLGRGEAVLASLQGSARSRAARVRVLPVWERFAAQGESRETEPARARKEQ